LCPFISLLQKRKSPTSGFKVISFSQKVGAYLVFDASYIILREEKKRRKDRGRWRE